MASILVLYHSQEFGNTDAMAQAIAQGVIQADAQPDLVNTDQQRLDIETYRASDAVAIGSPDYYSYIAGGLKTFFDDWYIAKKKNPQGLTDKSVAIFYSHGGGGRVRQSLEKLALRLGSQIGQTVESVNAPNQEVLDACRQLGAQLAQAAKT